MDLKKDDKNYKLSLFRKIFLDIEFIHFKIYIIAEPTIKVGLYLDVKISFILYLGIIKKYKVAEKGNLLFIFL